MSQGLKNLKYYRAFRVEVSKRDDVGLQVKTSLEDSSWKKVTIQNLSLTGSGFRSEHIFSADDEIECLVVFQDDEFHLPGKIVRRAEDQITGKFIYGVEFQRENQEISKLFIEKFVSTFSAKRLKKQFLDLLLSENRSYSSYGEEQLAVLMSLFFDMQKFDNDKSLIHSLLSEMTRFYQVNEALLFLGTDQPGFFTLENSSANRSEIGQVLYSDSLSRIFNSGGHVCFDKNTEVIGDDLGELAHFKDQNLGMVCTPIFDRNDNTLGCLVFFAKQGESHISERDFNGLELSALTLGMLLKNVQSSSEGDLVRFLKPTPPRKYALVGRSEDISKTREFIVSMKNCHKNVLITGEVGVGKTLLAKIIHTESERSHMPLGEIDCRELTESSFDNTFLGDDHNQGKLQLYSEGSLILKGIESLSKSMQDKLINFLNKVDYPMTIISTSSLDHKSMQNSFNIDLLKRLNEETFHINPLRERKDDITSLLNFFMRKECENRGLIIKQFSNDLTCQFIEHHWSGNVTELKRMVKRAVAYYPGAHIIEELPTGIVPLIQDEPVQEKIYKKIMSKTDDLSVEEFEKTLILNRYHEFDQDISKTAASLQVETTYIEDVISKNLQIPKKEAS